MTTTGLSKEKVEKMPEEKLLNALTYTDVTSTVSYYREPQDGTERVEMVKEDFYESMERSKELQNKAEILEVVHSMNPYSVARTAEEFPHDVEYPYDGYMEIESISGRYRPIYAEPNKDYFELIGIATWVKEPIIKGTDILAIQSSGFVDNHYDRQGMVSYYTNCTECGYVQQINTAKIGQHTSNGVYAYSPSAFGLAVKSPLILCGPHKRPEEPICFNWSATFFAWYGVICTPELSGMNNQVSYAHLKFGLTGLSVSISASGPSFSAGFGGQISEYRGRSFSLFYNKNYK